MLKKFIPVAIILSSCLVEFVRGDDGGNFITLPVTTELHHSLHRSPVPRPEKKKNGPQLRAQVLINGASLIDDSGEVIPDGLDFDALSKSLQAHRDPKNGIVRFRVEYKKLTTRVADKKISDRLAEVARKSGFVKAETTSSYNNSRFDWGQFTTRIELTRDDDDGQPEKAIGDKLIRVYPVRTRLSRYLTQDADVVVDIREVVKKDARDTLMPKLRAAVKKYVPKIDIDNTDGVSILLIRMRYERDAKGFSDWFAENSTAEFGPELGFQHVLVNGGIHASSSK